MEHTYAERTYINLYKKSPQIRLFIKNCVFIGKERYAIPPSLKPQNLYKKGPLTTGGSSPDLLPSRRLAKVDFGQQNRRSHVRFVIPQVAGVETKSTFWLMVGSAKCSDWDHSEPPVCDRGNDFRILPTYVRRYSTAPRNLERPWFSCLR